MLCGAKLNVCPSSGELIEAEVSFSSSITIHVKRIDYGGDLFLWLTFYLE